MSTRVLNHHPRPVKFSAYGLDYENFINMETGNVIFEDGF